jgi:outer membrane protein assembly factor BamB
MRVFKQVQGMRVVDRLAFGLTAALLAVLLAACSSSARRPDPAPLLPDPQKLSVRQVWSADLGDVSFPLMIQAAGSAVGVASDRGTVTLLDTRTGEALWQVALDTALLAGVGHDGRSAAVVTVENDLVVLQEGKELWRQRLTAPSYTPPLVAGGRVFVLGADRSVSAFDGQSGRRLWTQSRSGEPLVLLQPGVLMPVGDTLVVGWSGRLIGMNPSNGVSRWESPVASPRGTNDLERLVDLVAGVARRGNALCVRAFQSVVGCVDTARGALLWSKTANGGTGLTGDDQQVIGVESDGTVRSWRRSDGESGWTLSQLRYRRLGAPVLAGKALVIGDDQGLLHFLSPSDGSLLTRFETGSSPIAATPVLAGNTLVVMTRAGRVLGLRPE